jgi:putative FmdB family regulatory protein
MPQYKTGTYYCEECNAKFDELVEKEEYDTSKPQCCPTCGNTGCSRVVGAPLPLNNSFPDGTRRFTELKEVGKLRAEYAGLDYTDTVEQTRVKKEAEKIMPGASKDFKC